MIKLRWFLCSGVVLLAGHLMAQKMPSLSGPSPDRLDRAFAKLPLAFEPNRGQADQHVQFMARTPQATVFLAGPDAVLETGSYTRDEQGIEHLAGSSAVRMHLVNAADAPAFVSEQPLSGVVNYMRGNDRSRWQTNIPTFGSVRLVSVYPGIDLRYYGTSGQLEYDYILGPHADPGAVKMQFQGTSAHLDADGSLVLPASSQNAGHELRFGRPVAYQIIDGKRVPVPADFQISEGDSSARTVGFHLGNYDHSRELVIDPTLIFLGTLGTGTSPANTNLSQITVDAAGEMLLIGTTNDPNFPVTTSAYQKVCGPTKGNRDQVTYYGGYCPSSGNGEQAAFIAKLSADGTQLVYATYLSGQSGTEQGISITTDAAGVAYLLGTTGSDDFPVTSDAFQKNCYTYYGVFGGPNIVPCDGYYNGGGTEYTIGNQDAFIAKLSADGSSLLYSSFLGGTAPVYPNTIALDSAGSIYVSGQVTAFDTSDLTGCQQCGPNSQGQMQFTGITPSGYLTVSTAVSGQSNVSISNGAFLSKFSNDGHTLLYGTFFGDNTAGADVIPRTMAVGANGIVFIGGETNATNFPTTPGAVKSSCVQPGVNYGGIYCNTEDGFVAAIDTTKSGAASLVYSTRLGGATPAQGSNTDEQEVIGLAADSSNDVFVTGYTFDHTFPVGTGGYQATCPNYNPNDTFDRCDSAFVLKLDPTGTSILAGTFLDGPNPRSAESVGYNVRLDSKGQVYLYGRSNDGGGDFPQVNPLQPYKSGNQLFISAFTADLSKLLFSTRFGNPAYADHSVSVAGGLALDANDNIYFAGATSDTTFGTTPGTYTTPGATGNPYAFFAKLSPVLQPTSTTLTITPATLASGANLTLQAAVAGLYQNTPAASGTVTFTALATGSTTPVTLGTGTLDASGTVTTMVQAPSAGTYSVTASYAGDAIYDVSTSASATLTVAMPIAPTITLTASATSGQPNTQFTFTAQVTSGAGTPTGTVGFIDGSTPLGSGTLNAGVATYTTTLASGSHAITAQYSGDANFSAVTSAAQNITVAPVSLTYSYSPNPVVIKQGSTGTVTLTVTPDGPYTGSLALGCNGASVHISCSFSPSTLSFSNSSAAVTSTITITTQGAQVSQNTQTDVWRGQAAALAFLLLPIGFLARKRKLWSLTLMLLCLASVVMAGLSGCGGSGSSTPTTATGTPVGTTSLSITVNGADNGSPLRVTIQ